MSEIDAINAYEKKINSAKGKDGFSITKEDERLHVERMTKFNLYLPSVKTQIRSVAKQYNDYVRKYLQMLAAHSDINLQLLSVRLDFSSYYERVEITNNPREHNTSTIIKKKNPLKK